MSYAKKNTNDISAIDKELLKKIDLKNFKLDILEGRQLDKIYFAKNELFADL